MTLTFKVVGHDLGELFTDGCPRVRLRCESADAQFNEIRLRCGHDSLPMGAKIELECKTTQAEVLSK